MGDKIQVVRVDDEAQVGRWTQKQIDVAGLNGAAIPDVMYYLVPVGGAIELTEELIESHQDAEGFVGRPARRLVSKWGPVDG